MRVTKGKLRKETGFVFGVATIITPFAFNVKIGLSR